MDTLPKDLIKKLINEYLDGKSAFSCLTVSKRFAECANKKIVMEKYLKYLSYQEHEKYVEMIRDAMCVICNQIFLDKRKNPNNLKKHMEKHLIQEKSNKKIQIHKIPESCPYCDVPYIGDIPEHLRTCILRKIKCNSHQRIWITPFVKSLCTVGETYVKQYHTCSMQCLECDEIFTFIRGKSFKKDREYEDMILNHMNECANKEDMIAKYWMRKKYIFEDDVKYGCQYCGVICNCKCDTCGNNHVVNKIHDGRQICHNCAKCEICQKSWKDIPISEKNWKFLQLPRCNKCS